MSAPVSVSGSYAIAKSHGYIVGGTAEGIGTGMTLGALGSIEGGAQTGDPFGLALGIVLAPVFAVGGGIYGAAAAHSEQETESAITAIEKLYDDDAFLNALDALIEERIAELGFPKRSACNNSELRNEIKTRAYSSYSTRDEHVCEELKNTLTLHTSYGFLTEGVYSPDLQLNIEVTAVAANADRNRKALDFRWGYLSPELDFFSETANEAASLRQRLSYAGQQLADAMVHDLFLTRRQVKVTVNYFPHVEGAKFVPDALLPGTVSRIPTQSQLANVPE